MENDHYNLKIGKKDKIAKSFTWTPSIPKMMKNVQQMSTMFPIGLNDESKVWTTSFKPGARLITLKKSGGKKEGKHFSK